MNLPNDPVILLSFVNTKLRDEYPDLEELCLALGSDAGYISDKLSSIGYVYDSALNRFV